MPIKDKVKEAEYQRKYYQRMKQGMTQEQWKERLAKQAEYARTPRGLENGSNRQKRWRERNPEKNRDSLRRARIRRVQWYRDLKQGLKCERCGYDAHPAALDFHHRDPSTKTFTVSRAVMQNIDRDIVMAEIAKCMVLCRNCHAIIHWEGKQDE